jgi:quinoprotein glucose dehydrogenase
VNPVVTAGGDSATGTVLWEATVDAALEGMPAIYEQAGRQYVVFCAAARTSTQSQATPGHPASADRIPGAYVAFALQ